MDENNKDDIIEVEKVTDNEEQKVEQEPKTEEKQEAKTAEVVEDTETKKEEKQKKDRRGLCIASLVLGIVSLLIFCIWYISIPCAILAIIFGILGLKSKGKGMAIGGLVTGIISFVLSILIVIAIFAFGFVFGLTDVLQENGYDSLEEFYHDYEYRYDNDYYDYNSYLNDRYDI